MVQWLTRLACTLYSVPFFKSVQSILWNNAELGAAASLERKGALKNIVPCFDPTVVPLSPPVKGSSQAPTTYDPFSTLTTSQSQHDSESTTLFYSVSDYVTAYKSGKTTPTKVIEKVLEVISTDPLKAYYFNSLVSREIILAEAAASTERYKTGNPLPLDGVPLAVKDEIDVKGLPTTHGLSSEQTARRAKGKGAPATYTSFCVQKLLDAGMIFLGKTNMPELGLDPSGDNPHWGTPSNPFNPDYYTGGSSSGSAACVSAGLVPIAVGSDGGGSIRIPSAFTGIWGIKPSHGRVSTHPSPCYAPSVVVVGPLAATINDLELGYRVMATPEEGNEFDSSPSALFSPPGRIPVPSQKVLGICIPWLDPCDSQVRSVFESSVRLLQRKGYQVVNITLPYLNANHAAHRQVIMSELASMVCSVGADIAGLTPYTKILTSVSSRTTSYDFISANRLRTQMMEHLSHLFTAHPGLIILTPTTPRAGLRIPSGAGIKGTAGLCDGGSASSSMTYVYLANWTGCPSINMPCGYVEVGSSDGGKETREIPIGLMGTSEWGSEDLLLRLGHDWDDIWGSQIQRGKGWVDVLGL